MTFLNAMIYNGASGPEITECLRIKKDAISKVYY
jgi:hypothetical protein